jgi:hypothetical protein
VERAQRFAIEGTPDYVLAHLFRAMLTITANPNLAIPDFRYALE